MVLFHPIESFPRKPIHGHQTHLKDKLEICEGNDQTKVLWGQLLGRTEKGDWRWRDANGIEKTIADKEVIRTINGAGSPEPNFERGLANLAATAYRSGWAWLAVGLAIVREIDEALGFRSVETERAAGAEVA